LNLPTDEEEIKMAGIWTMGELLVEIMRPKAGMQLDEPGEFLGPFPSGAPAIFIDTVARLGHPSGIIGGVGDDDFGRCVVDRLKSDGVNCEQVQFFPNGATAVAFVTYFEDGSRKFIFHFGNTPAVWAKFTGTENVGQPTFFHVMGCSLMANDEFRLQIFKAVEFFFQHGAKISFDPNIRVELLGGKDLNEVVGPILEKCSILMPGVQELRLVSGETEIADGVKKLFGKPTLEMIVLKRGKEGCTIFTRETTVDVSAFKVDEVDPTGAGDCFDAGFLCGLLEQKPIAECGKMAAAAGALNAQAFGPMEGKINPDTLAAILKA
jgi:sugar/nucleoside kinase (ribokinase family)